uniref:Glutamyl-tRNA(Gln) amidotransferase subunit A-like n=1 Tax=Drosophila rhopaloa TaxID=1041015 RepID=A0A6P4FFQ0_DRORH
MDTATALLKRIETCEGTVRAFTTYDPVRIRMEAAQAPAGPLSGLSVGVKDIIDTVGYTTEHGSPIYAGNHSRGDAACVTQLRNAGAVCVGKTVTTEFAFFRAGPTVNPHDVTRTPGGSSSGSAAAVAAGMIDIGLASQTAASLTRPASYCGTVGFKPSYGRYAAAGIKSLAPSFDTLGTITRDVATAARADAVLKGPVATTSHLSPTVPTRIALCRTPHWDEAGEGTRHAVEEAARLFGAHVDVVELDLSDFSDAASLHITIMSYEASQALATLHNPEQKEGAGYIAFPNGNTVVSEDENMFLSKTVKHARPLVIIERDAFEIMISDTTEKLCPIEIVVAETILFHRDSTDGIRVGVNDAVNVIPRAMNGTMQSKAGRIGFILSVTQ